MLSGCTHCFFRQVIGHTLLALKLWITDRKPSIHFCKEDKEVASGQESGHIHIHTHLQTFGNKLAGILIGLTAGSGRRNTHNTAKNTNYQTQKLRGTKVRALRTRSICHLCPSTVGQRASEHVLWIAAVCVRGSRHDADTMQRVCIHKAQAVRGKIFVSPADMCSLQWKHHHNKNNHYPNCINTHTVALCTAEGLLQQINPPISMGQQQNFLTSVIWIFWRFWR